MASTSETGHAKNVSNFQILINSCTGFGAPYQPTRNALQLPALTAQHTACAAADAAVDPLRIAYNRIAAERKELFVPLSGGLVTQLLAMFSNTDALQQVKDFAKTLANKLRGRSKKTPAPPAAPGDTPEDVRHSTSQRSFAMLTDNFSAFIETLAAEPTYAPAELELRVATLQAMLAAMTSKNNEVDLAYQALRDARTARNSVLYAKDTGLVDVALDVKEYVKAAFGTKSPQFKAVKGLQFTRIASDPNA